MGGLTAPFILDGPMDGVAFLTYVRRVCPEEGWFQSPPTIQPG
jgi:hypothetical protein